MDPRSLIGMTMGARKRRARAVAFYYIDCVTMLDIAIREARKVHAQRFSDRGFPRHRYDREQYAEVRTVFRIGVRLCPCMLCHGEIGIARCNARHGAGKPCPFCEPCGTRPKKNKTKWRPCDGSGVHLKGQRRLTEEEMKPKPELIPFDLDLPAWVI